MYNRGARHAETWKWLMYTWKEQDCTSHHIVTEVGRTLRQFLIEEKPRLEERPQETNTED